MSGLRTVREVMSPEVTTLLEDDSLSIADDVMKLGRIRHMPVVDREGRAVGIVSQRDLFRGALTTFLGYGEHAQRGVLNAVKVRDVMASPPRTIGPEDDLTEAARRLEKYKIGCLVVVERGDPDGKPIGILTEGDFVRLHMPARI